MKTKEQVIAFAKSELSSNNTLVIATLGSGGAGLALIQGQENDNFILELEGYDFDGLQGPCPDIKESEYYNDDCEVYQFSGDHDYMIQILTY